MVKVKKKENTANTEYRADRSEQKAAVYEFMLKEYADISYFAQPADKAEKQENKECL